jgi:hypothetical protein
MASQVDATGAQVAILADGLSPEGRDYWVYDEMLPVDKRDGLHVPRYTVKEVAVFFFARSADWLRWRSRPAPGHPQGYFVLDGEVLEPSRTEAGARYYTLSDVERMAHALTQNGGLSTGKLIETIMLVKWTARLYEVDIDNGAQ